MAKKKVKSRASAGKSKARIVKSYSKHSNSRRPEVKSVHDIYSKKMGISFMNFVVFAIVSLVSYLLYTITTNEVFISLFYLLYILAFFISLAFLISFFVFVFLRMFNKK